MELDHNDAEREGRLADAPAVDGRAEMLGDRIDTDDQRGTDR